MPIRDSGRLNQAVLISILFFSVALVGCESWLPDAHRIDLTQGNSVERKELDKIQPGMTRAEITSIIGYPMVVDPFHTDRWDYIYRYIPGRGEAMQSRITLFFEGDKLVKIDDSAFRDSSPAEEGSITDRETVEAVPKLDID